ncbi:hypothetical protein [Virgisporangium aurantiacum]|uniref:Uncharacterized protein n=1 Tax=Virgisporangium aurantiacum TaxID=175570 RepID=A0A8J4E6R7_9ACTN|nr:hypothetical protein [Virgisporangium aurantiacum]GIJ64375.1 hypothetical protein Vau01_118910 [Virgisporangium aurantiacum]
MDERSFHPISLALWGNMVAHDWWGSPRYAELVSLLCADLPAEIPGWDEEPDLLEGKLLVSPWEIPLETWNWCLKHGLAWDYRPDAWETSLTPLNRPPPDYASRRPVEVVT